jgi:hypothetical protein
MPPVHSVGWSISSMEGRQQGKVVVVVVVVMGVGVGRF